MFRIPEAIHRFTVSHVRAAGCYYVMWNCTFISGASLNFTMLWMTSNNSPLEIIRILNHQEPGQMFNSVVSWESLWKGILSFKIYLHPGKLTWQWKNNTIGRCIHLSKKIGIFQKIMLVFKQVDCFSRKPPEIRHPICASFLGSLVDFT